MANIKFEGQDRRQDKLNKILPEYGFKTLEDARALCEYQCRRNR